MQDVGWTVAERVALVVVVTVNGEASTGIPFVPIAMESEKAVAAHHVEFVLVEGGNGSVIQLIHGRPAAVGHRLQIPNDPAAMSIQIQVATSVCFLSRIDVMPLAAVPTVPTLAKGILPEFTV